jgi:short-subunit dehydrogenase
MPRPINEQVIVITGASSGIGRATALRFGKMGATVVLAARNVIGLEETAREIQSEGGQPHVVPTDVAEWPQVERLALHAVEMFGRIDTWVNNAGVAVYATAENTTVEETSRVLQVNFMGIVHGVKAVLPYMRQQGYGTIINLGSVESKRALPYHSAYTASKHAVKAYTDSLRMELQREKSGINVTLILPAGINTPFFNHARSKFGVKPMPVPPVYAPELVAEAIVTAAQHPQRDIYVGGAGMFLAILERISPALSDRVMTTGGTMFKLQKTNEPDNGVDTLFETIPEVGRIHGDFSNITKPSMYTRFFELMPAWQRLAVPTLVAGLFAFLNWRRR